MFEMSMALRGWAHEAVEQTKILVMHRPQRLMRQGPIDDDILFRESRKKCLLLAPSE
jgi:hypothetical protein